ncbi:L10-interacting MYB domain-containing protein-like [Phalaenopsis equestris]|uniref:L10-interacting MYB domain-containing protein-like n=1 Tax=Phalaenopsis equestris TaxID=78828 RepID=UPI0009E42ECE|nr:L10-interacting MYB domain-containing protein-like [Phalaenopsis equestris]XP_020578876.1 L10-interacting MYB domain-containing protein-like [Phalaenopsis equestris]XP_020588036.1 L10-interacting MYB domain-containing protein-like [Phalaenopsis equestris]XP_020595885.1 L10-interacting MYB domain-containing protein-like [Phalaenopsis equestris]
MAGKSKEHGSPAIWEKEIKLLFCDLCIKEIELGNRPTTFFNKEGWNSIIKHFKDSTGREYDRLQMKNKWDQLKKDWKIWKDLKRGSTGLGWDPIKRTIDASEEWWAERLAVVPAAKKYKTCGIEPELEEKLDQMFGGVVATGKYACAPSETGFGETQDNVAVSLSDDSPEFPSAGPTEIQSTNRSKRSRFESKKKGGAATIRNQISCLMDSSNDAPHKVQKTSINEVVAILEQDPSIAADDELYYFAVELLQDSVQRDFFTAIAKERRVSYLRHFFECKKI